MLSCLWKFYPQLSPQLKWGDPRANKAGWRRQHSRVRLLGWACHLASALPCGLLGLGGAAGSPG